ncbi:MAG TPA: hypothetical protein VK425_06405 [Acidimicrobiales bacterium]|nr:hypothetical protein [Acidimicrobiales bacterium]
MLDGQEEVPLAPGRQEVRGGVAQAKEALLTRLAQPGVAFVLLAAVIAVIFAQGSAAASTRSTTIRLPSMVCPSLIATPWQLPYAPYTKGDEYDVKVNKYSCGSADQYIKILTANKVFKTPSSLIPPPSPPSNVKGGPKGLSCRAIPDKSGRAYDGGCYTYSGGLANMNKPWFAWTVG